MLHSVFVANKQSVPAVSASPPLEPLSPRSIVLSLLLGSHPPQMPVGRILEFTALFDIADGAVRTALSRMVTAGDLITDDGPYRLASRLLERQAQQDAGRVDPARVWDGTWWTVAVLAERRTMAERRAFRSQAVGARLGELRPDVWLRPANVAIPSDLPGVLVTRGPILGVAERQLVAQLWDLDVIGAEAIAHRCALDQAAARLAEPDDRALADAFVALAAAQRFLRTEPQLPIELSSGAPGGDVRGRYSEVVDNFQSRLGRFYADGADSDPGRGQ